MRSGSCASAGVVTADGSTISGRCWIPGDGRAERSPNVRARCRTMVVCWCRAGERFIRRARRTTILRRYGVVFRDLLAREYAEPVVAGSAGSYRRMEFQGEIRGGRFVDGFVGEQFALPRHVESSARMRREGS
jgi:hypothetical protein